MSTDPTRPLPTSPDDGTAPDITTGHVAADHTPDHSPAETATTDHVADDAARAAGADETVGTYVPSAAAASAYPPPAWMPPVDPPREVSTSVRSSTIVWGAILVVAGVVLGASAAGLSLDVGLVAIVALAGAGVALLVGALTSALRRSRRERAN